LVFYVHERFNNARNGRPQVLTENGKKKIVGMKIVHGLSFERASEKK
jgi:hypothetical protein